MSVHLYLDNTKAIAYVNRCGGTRSSALTSIAKDLVSFCEERELTVVAFHLPSAQNIITDAESRALVDVGDLMLDRVVAGGIFDLWPCEVDLFSAAWNAQLDRFVFWRPQPGAIAVNTFSVCWKDLQGNSSPPNDFDFVPKDSGGSCPCVFTTCVGALNHVAVSFSLLKSRKSQRSILFSGRVYGKYNMHSRCYACISRT